MLEVSALRASAWDSMGFGLGLGISGLRFRFRTTLNILAVRTNAATRLNKTRLLHSDWFLSLSPTTLLWPQLLQHLAQVGCILQWRPHDLKIQD